jgi:hypothetical protein
MGGSKTKDANIAFFHIAQAANLSVWPVVFDLSISLFLR